MLGAICNSFCAALKHDQMSSELWTAIDDYFNGILIPADPVMDAVLRACDAAGLPPHHVAPNQGKFLMLLARIQGARNILEIGTLGGYSTIWLARGLPAGGRLITLESNPAFAEVARANIARASLADVVEVRVGRAIETLPQLVAERRGPFDLVFIDADKKSNPDYLPLILELSRSGTTIFLDNVVRDGDIIDAASTDPSVQGVRAVHELLAGNTHADATTIQTVGSKGHDGFTVVIVS